MLIFYRLKMLWRVAEEMRVRVGWWWYSRSWKHGELYGKYQKGPEYDSDRGCQGTGGIG